MALRLATTPLGAETAMRAGVASVATPERTRSLGAGQELRATAPHPVYTLAVEDLAGGRALAESARLIGWRYLLMRGDTPESAVELSCASDGSRVKFAGLSRGPFVAATYDAIRIAEHVDAVVSGEYELRLLRIPALYAMALWLKGMEGDGDIVLPIGSEEPGTLTSQPRDLSSMASPRALTTESFVEALRPAAQRALRSRNEQ